MKIIRLPLKSIWLLVFFIGITSQIFGMDNQEPDCDPCKLEVALNNLSEYYTVLFSYKTSLIEDVEVSFEINEEENFDAALNRLLSGLDLKYKSIDTKYYFLYSRENENGRNMRKMERKIKSLRNLEQETGIRLFKRPDNDQIALKRIYESVQIQLEGIIVEGSVVDEEGEPLIGVNILVKNTNKGTTTDIEGRFTLEDIDEQAVLVISYVGYERQEFPVAGRTNLAIIMKSDSQLLDEVVVVGYGTQKKVNLTGSISTIDEKDLTIIPTPTIAQAMMGRASGVFIKNISGQPGDDNAVEFNIRGYSEEPLIIIDGMEATKHELNQLNPNDIQDFSILKDAAAGAIYGARAGDGVILVTTKRGQAGKAQFSFSSDYGLEYFAVFPDFVNAAQYAQMENLGSVNAGRNPIWTDEQIQKLKEGTDPKFPDNDWSKLVLRKYAPQLNQNLSIRGGSDKVKYFVSGGYYHQEALPQVNQTDLDRYNIRSNIDIALTRRLGLGLSLAATSQKFTGPLVGMNSDYEGTKQTGIATRIRNRPFLPASYPDPTKLPSQDNPIVLSNKDNVGYLNKNRLRADAKVSISYDLPFNIKSEANFQFSRMDYRYKKKETKTQLYKYDWDTDIYTPDGFTNPSNTLYESINLDNGVNQQYLLSWDKNIKNHFLGATAVYEILSRKYENFNASRRDYIFDIDYLFAGPETNKDNSGSGGRDGRKGLVSRINYNYKEKYLLELSSRYDASPKFPRDTRWGFFPSASIAWRISEENFIKDRFPFIGYLKLRGSYGTLGRDKTGAFQYLDTYSQNAQYIFGGVLYNGIKADVIPNPNITWEKMEISNIGLDFDLWSGKLGGSIEYFYRFRKDVLLSRLLSIPDVSGAKLPKVNYGKFDNRGWELNLEYRNRAGGIDYGIGGNVSMNREKNLLVDQDPFANEEARRRGNKIGQWTDVLWGYMSDGLFQTPEEIDAWPDLDGKNNASRRPGDVKLIDYNGDGRVTTDDKVIIGRGRYPRFTYGVNMNMAWKNFDFSMLWQGAGHFDLDLSRSRDFSKPFLGGGKTPLVSMLTDSYTPENPWLPAITDARWPLYGDLAYSRKQQRKSSYTTSEVWLVKGDYIRLKTAQLGYTISSDLVKTIGLTSCKVYLSGYNLLTFSELNFLDPEADQSPVGGKVGEYYPITGTFNAGILLQF